ncbi:hypothetical protein CCH79_00003407 [Gambusia affinis]|uniref:Transmembrane protein 238 n=1 Tax=Gambusia affinis TaxID=33528 RepID=A0A315VDH2_GAMAF|nr:hypothetical protein CCH79_00003407 [Gambusia affinis]
MERIKLTFTSYRSQIGRCVGFFFVAVLLDAVGLVVFVTGIASPVGYWDFLVLSGPLIVFLSLVFWILWYIGNVEVPTEELTPQLFIAFRWMRKLIQLQVLLCLESISKDKLMDPSVWERVNTALLIQNLSRQSGSRKGSFEPVVMRLQKVSQSPQPGPSLGVQVQPHTLPSVSLVTPPWPTLAEETRLRLGPG